MLARYDLIVRNGLLVDGTTGAYDDGFSLYICLGLAALLLGGYRGAAKQLSPSACCNVIYRHIEGWRLT
jgi:hypothetical protein